MPDVADMPEDLPEWASAGNYSAPGEPWDAQSRLNDALMPSLAAAGLIPAVPTDAPGFNSWLRRVWELLSTMNSDLWGSRYSGDVTVSVSSDLSADLHCDTLTVNPGVTLNANGWRIFATQIVNNGVIYADGLGGAAGLVSGPGAGGIARSGGTTAPTVVGGAGANVGGNGSAGTSTAACRIGALGGAGGAAGIYTGGARGTGGALPTGAQGRAQGTNGDVGHLYQAIAGRALDGTIFAGGSSGGGGAGDTGRGGGGGAGAGVLILVARSIENNGIIRARGGVGGAGYLNGGGGGGGGGGAVIIVTHTAVTGSAGAAAITAAGGVGGAAGSGGASAGANGSAGTVYYFAA